MLISVLWIVQAWFIVLALALVLFVSHLLATLPPDPAYRRRLVRWLTVVAVAALFCRVWVIWTNHRLPSAVQPQVSMDRSWFR